MTSGQGWRAERVGGVVRRCWAQLRHSITSSSPSCHHHPAAIIAASLSPSRHHHCSRQSPPVSHLISRSLLSSRLTPSFISLSYSHHQHYVSPHPGRQVPGRTLVQFGRAHCIKSTLKQEEDERKKKREKDKSPFETPSSH